MSKFQVEIPIPAPSGRGLFILVRNHMDPKELDTPPPKEVGEKGQRLSSERERAAVIASVMRHEAERAEIRESVRAPGPRPLLPQLIGLAMATAVAAYVWFGSPAWIEPDPVPLPPVEVEVATLRLTMFIQAQAIENYRSANGRTPAFLEEAGPPHPGLTYRRLDARTYLLQGQGERVRLTYTSRDSLPAFLGAAAEALLSGALDQ